MKNISPCILLTFSVMTMLNGNKRVLVSDPQYAQNIVHAFEVKLEQLNQHVVQQDNIISSLQNNITSQESINRRQMNETQFRLGNATHRLAAQGRKYQQTVEKLQAQEAINHILLSRLSTQESLNTKLTQDLDNKTKELHEHLIPQNQQFSNHTN